MGTVIIIVDTVAVVVLSIAWYRGRVQRKKLEFWVDHWSIPVTYLDESNNFRNTETAEPVQKQEQPTD